MAQERQEQRHRTRKAVNMATFSHPPGRRLHYAAARTEQRDELLFLLVDSIYHDTMRCFPMRMQSILQGS